MVKISPKVEVRESPLHGMGVFAIKSIEEGEVIEVSYCILIPLSEYKRNETVGKYFFTSPTPQRIAMPLGCAMIYNHSPYPNLEYSFLSKDIIEFVASKPIKVGEEICHRYCEEKKFEKNYLT
jgi:SET domain-containing protein